MKIPTFDEHALDLSSDDDENTAENWEVHNVADKKKNYKRMRYKQSDLMVMLIDLYGSEEAFIQEYESMLAEKLLLNTKYNITEEIKNSELLKQRFGEAKLNRYFFVVKKIGAMLYSKTGKIQTGLTRISRMISKNRERIMPMCWGWKFVD